MIQPHADGGAKINTSKMTIEDAREMYPGVADEKLALLVKMLRTVGYAIVVNSPSEPV